MASGKMRQCAYDKLNSTVNLLGWQQGGRMPKEQFDAWLAEAEALYSTGKIFKIGIKNLCGRPTSILKRLKKYFLRRFLINYT